MHTHVHTHTMKNKKTPKELNKNNHEYVSRAESQWTSYPIYSCILRLMAGTSHCNLWLYFGADSKWTGHSNFYLYLEVWWQGYLNFWLCLKAWYQGTGHSISDFILRVDIREQVTLIFEIVSWLPMAGSKSPWFLFGRLEYLPTFISHISSFCKIL